MAAPGDVSEGLWSCDAGWWRSPWTQVTLSGKAHERWWERRTHQSQDSTPPLLLLMSAPGQATHSCLWGLPLLCSYLKLSFSPPTTPTSSSPSLHVSDIQDSTAATATPFRNRNLPLQSVVVLYPITSMKCTNRSWEQETLIPDPVCLYAWGWEQQQPRAPRGVPSTLVSIVITAIASNWYPSYQPLSLADGAWFCVVLTV